MEPLTLALALALALFSFLFFFTVGLVEHASLDSVGHEFVREAKVKTGGGLGLVEGQVEPSKRVLGQTIPVVEVKVTVPDHLHLDDAALQKHEEALGLVGLGSCQYVAELEHRTQRILVLVVGAVRNVAIGHVGKNVTP